MQSATNSMSAARSLLTNDVAIELKMFAQPAALLFFVAKELADREPFERLSKFAFVRRDHARKRRREFGAQRDLAFAFVSEFEKLIRQFLRRSSSYIIRSAPEAGLPIRQIRNDEHVCASGEKM